MSVTSGRGRRVLAAVTTAALIVAGAVLGTATAATADTLPSPAPLLQRDSNVATADNLPTVQINDGYVWAQTTIGTTVYAVGSFTNTRPAGAAVGTNLTPRANILAYDITTGNLITSFAPTTNGPVKSVAASPDGKRIYIGGSFNTVNGQTRYNFAALDATTGALISGFSPSVGGTGVYAIATAGNAVYLGGLFTQANATGRINLAAFSATNGALLPWAPTTDRQVDAMVMEPGNAKVIAAGRFYQTNSQVQRGLVALDPTSGAIITSWQAPNTVVNGWSTGSAAGMAGIFGLNADANAVYGTGWVYASVNEGNLEGVFAANAGDGSIRWVADCHGDHYGVYSDGTTVYATSHTHQCDTVSLAPEQPTRTFRYAEAFTADARGLLSRSPSVSSIYKDWSGTPSPSAYSWVPDFTVGTTSGLGQAGLSVTGTGDYVSIGGEFGSVNNKLVQGLVRFSKHPSTGAKEGPRLNTATWAAPTAVSVSPGTARVSIPANWDRDDLNLTYELRRSGVSTPVATKVVSSMWFNMPPVSLLDTGLTPGASQTYTVTVKDGDGNAVTSQPVTVTIASGQASAYGNKVLEDGASLFYRLGGVTQDWGGSSNPTYGSTVTTLTPGAISETGSAASTFSGSTNGNGRVTSSATVPAGNDFSVEIWFKTNTTKGGKLIGYGSKKSGLSDSYDRQLYMANNGQVLFGVYPGAIKTVSSTSTYNDNAWHYAVGSLDAGGMKLYVDGALVGSDTSVTTAQAYSGYWRIGGDSLASWTNQPSSNYFAGSLDEAAVYPMALTAGQVSSHYAVAQGLTPPTSAFSASATNLAASFDASASTVPAGRTITGYAWNFGDGATGTGVAANHTYGAAGTYSVTLTITDSAGLTDAVTNPITVSAANVLPTASFTSTTSGLTASVNGSASTDSDGTIASYSWNWGDGTADSTGVTASHTYSTEGSHTITLTVTDDRSGVDTQTGTVTVSHAAPTADFSSVVSGLAVSVDGTTSSAADGATLAYSWNWGDATSAGTGATASHTYATAGTRTVTLTVTDSLGKTATTNSSVTVSTVTYLGSDSFDRTVSSGWGAADIGGTWSALYGAASAASVSGGQGKITLPAGQTRNMALSGVSVRDSQTTVQFSVDAAPSTGNSYVGLVSRQSATNDYTLRAYLQSNGAVWLIAKAWGTILQTQTSTGVTWAAGDVFTMKTEVSGSSPTTIKMKIWKAGTAEPSTWQLTTTDSTVGPQQAGAPNLHFARAGSSTSTATVSFDEYRLVNLQGAPVNTPPTAAFTSTTSGLAATVNGSGSTDAEGAIASYSWNWGDGTAAGSGATPAAHTYASANTYQVTLTVTDAGGLTNSVTHPVTVSTAPPVNTPPTAAFTSTTSGLAATVNGSGSTDAEGAIASYSWNWGDGTAAGSGATPAAHTYASANTYQVTLTVTDAGGLTDSVAKSVTVSNAGPDLSAFLAGDDFGRTSASGWGTADKGGAWTTMYGAASSTSVSGGAGVISIAAGQTRNQALQSLSVQDVAIQTDISLAEAPATGNSYVGVVARQNATDSYQVRVWLRNDGGVWLVTQHGNTVLNSAAIAGITRAAGDTYTLSVQVTGSGTTTIQAKLWKTGTTEPAAWQVTSTDTTAGLQGAGYVALHANRSGASTSAGTFTFDNFRVKAL